MVNPVASILAMDTRKDSSAALNDGIVDELYMFLATRNDDTEYSSWNYSSSSAASDLRKLLLPSPEDRLERV